MDWQPKAHQYLLTEQYSSVIDLYEQEIESNPDEMSHYWYLGLAYLLDEQEDTAQTIWLMTIAQGNEVQACEWTLSLERVLESEAVRLLNNNKLQTSWVVRQHLHELDPDNIANLLNLVELSIDLGSFDTEILESWEVIKYLEQTSEDSVDCKQLLRTVKKSLNYLTPEVLEFAQKSLRILQNQPDWIHTFILSALKIGEEMEQPGFAAKLTESLLEYDNNNLELLKHLCRFLISSKSFKKASLIAKKYCENSISFSDIFLSNYLLLRVLTFSGAWLQIEPVVQRHRELLRQIFEEKTKQDLTIEVQYSLVPAVCFWAYLQDNLPENRYFQNTLGNLFASKNLTYQFASAKKDSKSSRLKIGYLSHTLRAHSVGWLSRWLFEYYDRNKFDVSLYFVNHNLKDAFYHDWFASKVESAQSFEIDAKKIANKIHEDNIDILVDLDSSTLNTSYEVMSLKPAPIQVTWLGWDASGLPTIDYFITDPYVLAENAQEYYQEKIWRLPHTYIAVDGFEVGIPTLRREDLNIPNDAIVFLSSQAGIKRHPKTIHAQLRILKEVPDSYFLVKAIGDADAVKEVFLTMAEQESISPDRLKFIGYAPSEYSHRANLQIADVVLDTYPYNGATTTLETLWMGVPIVTRVGTTFSSRNSYSFMMNVGVTEGIAWTDEEYIEWGIRLGRDETLRQHVAWKLRQSRQTSPLWNAKQFTREMENAYQQMWEIYAEKENKI
jgi:predicted O-linked N-acetylglucosamine transferase (SPINDLY family)